MHTGGASLARGQPGHVPRWVARSRERRGGHGGARDGGAGPGARVKTFEARPTEGRPRGAPLGGGGHPEQLAGQLGRERAHVVAGAIKACLDSVRKRHLAGAEEVVAGVHEGQPVPLSARWLTVVSHSWRGSLAQRHQTRRCFPRFTPSGLSEPLRRGAHSRTSSGWLWASGPQRRSGRPKSTAQAGQPVPMRVLVDDRLPDVGGVVGAAPPDPAGAAARG